MKIKNKILIYSVGLSLVLLTISNLIIFNVVKSEYEKDKSIYILQNEEKRNYYDNENKYVEIKNINLKEKGVININIREDGSCLIKYSDVNNEEKYYVEGVWGKDFSIKESMKIILALFNILTILIISIISINLSKIVSKKINSINDHIDDIVYEEDESLNTNNEEDEFSKIITKIDKLKDEFEGSFDKLNKEKLYKRQLMLSLSHEIKTPIGGLNGILEGMLDGVEPYTDRNKYIRECRKISGRLTQISNEMLDVTKLDSKIEGREEVNLSILINEIVEGFQSIALLKNIDIKVNIDSRLTLFTDGRILKRALVNVVENSIKYSYDNSDVEIYSKGYILNIYNKCDGLTNEDYNFIFKPLYRGTTKKDTSGRGIGLYVVSQCFEAISIKYEFSNYKEGVLFKINIKGDEIWDCKY